MLDKCAYCGQVYHPMPVYTRKPGAPADGKPFRIWACDRRIIKHNSGEAIDPEQVIKVYPELDFTLVKTGCNEKALADGYICRRDLTPTR